MLIASQQSPGSARGTRSRFTIGVTLAVGLLFANLSLILPTQTVSAESPTGRSLTQGKRRDEVVDVYDRVKAAIVNIHSERTVNAPSDDPFNRAPVRPQQVNGMGTGIVIDPRGYILTNFHVVDDVQALRTRLYDNSGYPARIVMTDKEADLAIIKIDASRPLPIVAFGTSSDLMVGESVIAIGNAYGYEHTVTHGRVSYKGRDVTLNKDTGYKGLIQTSAPINPGNSGGPLLNVLGELVGVNVAIRAGAQNIGFALPIDFVIGRASDMLARIRGGSRHGLTLKDSVTRSETEAPARRTVVVEAVESGSPAASAGFKVGDTIEQIDETAVTTSIDVERSLVGRASTSKSQVKVNRAGSVLSLELSLDAIAKVSASISPSETTWKRLGVRVQPVGAEAVARANPQLHGGLLVAEINVGGVAASAGVQKGDIIVGLHTWETLRIEDITFVLNHKDLGNFLPLKFLIARDGKLRDGWIAGVP